MNRPPSQAAEKSDTFRLTLTDEEARQLLHVVCNWCDGTSESEKAAQKEVREWTDDVLRSVRTKLKAIRQRAAKRE